MGVMDDRRRILLTTDQDLPPIYKPVEYIESSGTQFIDTGVTPADDLELDADISLTNSALSATRNYIFGLSGGNFRVQFSYSAGAYSGWGTVGASGTISVNTDRHKVELNRNAFTVDGSTVYTPSSHTFSTVTYGVYMFARNAAGVLNDVANGLRFYSASIKKNGTMIRDFVPCVRMTDNKTGMYDKTNHKFYQNGGTGEFITP